MSAAPRRQHDGELAYFAEMTKCGDSSVVDNRGGAGGIIDRCRREIRSEGYSRICKLRLAVNPMPPLGAVRPGQRLRAVTMTALSHVLVVNAKFACQHGQGLIALAKKGKPGELTLHLGYRRSRI